MLRLGVLSYADETDARSLGSVCLLLTRPESSAGSGVAMVVGEASTQCVLA